MADKIKKFFARKKAETKFKLAGPGRNLTQQSSSSGSKSKPDKDAYIPPQRKELSGEARAAAEAAMARTQKRDVKEFNTSLAAIQVQFWFLFVYFLISYTFFFDKLDMTFC